MINVFSFYGVWWHSLVRLKAGLVVSRLKWLLHLVFSNLNTAVCFTPGEHDLHVVWCRVIKFFWTLRLNFSFFLPINHVFLVLGLNNGFLSRDSLIFVFDYYERYFLRKLQGCIRVNSFGHWFRQDYHRGYRHNALEFLLFICSNKIITYIFVDFAMPLLTLPSIRSLLSLLMNKVDF